MRTAPNQKHAKALLILSVMLAVVFSLGIRFIDLKTGIKSSHHLFFLEDGKPLLTSMDGYYYLKLTEEYLSDGSAGGVGSVPLLILISAQIQKITQAPLEKVAFYLPPILALLMILVYFWWGREFGGTLTFLLATIIGMGSYYWCTRTCLGRFDTDGLIPFFVYGISFLMYRFSVNHEWKRRATYLAAALLMAYFFQWWWPPGLYLNLFILIFPYALTLFFWPSNQWEKYLKLFFLGTGVVGATIIVFDLSFLLPEQLRSPFQTIGALFNLVTKADPAGLPGLGASISELEPISWNYLSENVAGHSLLLIMSLAGFGLLLKRDYRKVIVLAFPILLGVASFFAERFLIYLIPIYALSLAYFLKWLSGLTWRQQKPSWLRQIIMALLCLTILTLNSAQSFRFTSLPQVTSSQATLANTINEEASTHAVIWNWWDAGYFLQYYGKRPTMMDGGNQARDRFFVAAFPLTSPDPTLARNWIKFFAAQGIAALHHMNAHFKDLGKTIRFLKAVFAQPENLNTIITEFGLKDGEKWRSYLFPQKEVYLYLSFDMLKTVYWWFYFGSSDDRPENAIHPLAAILKGKLRIDQKHGVVVLRGKKMFISDLYFLALTPVPHINGHKTYQHDPLIGLIWVKEHDVAYLFGHKLLDSLFTNLLLLNPLSPPRGFQTVKYIPFQGGVWRVE